MTKAYFTAAEAGVYTLNLALEEGSGFVLVQTELNSRSSSNLSTTSERSYALAAGESIYFTPKSGMKGSITINKEASMKDITVGADIGIPAGKTWLRFVAPEYGTYQFMLSNRADSVKYYPSNNISEDWSSSYDNADIEIEADKDQSGYFLIETKQPIRIQVQQIVIKWAYTNDPESFEDGYRLDKGDTTIIKLENYEYSAVYDIILNATQNVKVSYKWEDGSSYQDLKSDTKFKIPVTNFYVERVLCIKLTGLSNNTTVNLNPVFVANMVNMWDSYFEEASYPINKERTFQFTAPKAGSYSFRLYEENSEIENDLLYGVLKNMDGKILVEETESYDSEYEYGSLWLSCNLEKGQTVRLTVSSKLSYSEDERCINLNIRLDTNVTLREGSLQSDNIIYGERVDASFNPTESGRYRFYIYNNSNECLNLGMYGDVYDWDEYSIYEYDYYEFELDMESNKKLWLNLQLTSYDYEGTGNYQIRVEKVSETEE